MPTILKIGPYRFHFYSGEGNEPPHIHVAREDLEAKFWLQPVSLAANYGFRAVELSRKKTRGRALPESNPGVYSKAWPLKP
jgi:hypothetical protein